MKLQRIRRTLLFFSFMLFSFTFVYLSPFMAIYGTYYGVAASGLVFWTLVLLTSPFLGRSVCSYICPMGGLQDCLHDGLEKPHVRVRYLKAVKYLIWAGWIGAIITFAVMRGGWTRIDLLYKLGNGLPPYPRDAYIVMLVFLLITALPAMLLGRRGSCHYFCFFAPMNIIGMQLGRMLHLPALRVKVAKQSNCKNCSACNRVCPMSLDVAKMVQEGSIQSSECITCGNCSAVCKFDVLKYGVSQPQKKRAGVKDKG